MSRYADSRLQQILRVPAVCPCKANTPGPQQKTIICLSRSRANETWRLMSRAAWAVGTAHKAPRGKIQTKKHFKQSTQQSPNVWPARASIRSRIGALFSSALSARGEAEPSIGRTLMRGLPHGAKSLCSDLSKSALHTSEMNPYITCLQSHRCEACVPWKQSIMQPMG